MHVHTNMHTNMRTPGNLEERILLELNHMGNPNDTCCPMWAQLVSIQGDMSLEQIYEKQSLLARCLVPQMYCF